MNQKQTLRSMVDAMINGDMDAAKNAFNKVAMDKSPTLVVEALDKSKELKKKPKDKCTIVDGDIEEKKE